MDLNFSGGTPQASNMPSSTFLWFTCSIKSIVRVVCSTYVPAMDGAYLDDKAAKVELRQDLENYPHTLGVGYHWIVLPGYVKVLYTAMSSPTTTQQ